MSVKTVPAPPATRCGRIVFTKVNPRARPETFNPGNFFIRTANWRVEVAIPLAQNGTVKNPKIPLYCPSLSEPISRHGDA